MVRTWESLALRVKQLEQRIEELELEQEELDEESDAWGELQYQIDVLNGDLYEAEKELG